MDGIPQGAMEGGAVHVISLIVFLWFRGLNEDAITKLGKNVELVCGDVSFSADYDSPSSRLSIVNDSKH